MKTSVHPTAKTTAASQSEIITVGSLSGWALVLLGLFSQLLAENKRLRAQVADLTAALTLERAKRFGDSSERRPPPPQETAQTFILEGEVSATFSAPEDKPGLRRPPGGQPGHHGAGRSLAPDLPRQEEFSELPEGARCCPTCGLPYAETTLTEDSEEIEVTVKAHVRRYRRKRYRRQCACPGPTFLTAPRPPKLIPKGKFSLESWVKFLLDKYQAQLPVTRQLQQLAHLGLPVAKSTLHGGFKKLYTYLLPLYAHFLNHLRTARHLHADETRWRVFADVEGKTNPRWWLWLFASAEVGVVVFVLDPSRSANVPKKYLAERLPPAQTEVAGREVNLIEGQAYALSDQLAVISADRLRVYQAISDLLQVAFCWSHQRRDFTDFQQAHADQPLLVAWAASWVEEIAQLYALNQHRLAVRHQPDLYRQAQAELEAAIAAMKNRTSARQSLTDAQKKILTSMARHWSGLTLFVQDPSLPMDNNWAERLLRSPVLGRKNYYGHRAQWAGELAAIVFSIVETCLLNGLNPNQFLVSYFRACAEHGNSPPDLTPFSPWLNSQPAPS